MSTNQLTERKIHNGEILDPVPGVYTEAAPALPIGRQTPQGLQDNDPDELAAAMAKCLADALVESPVPSPMELVNRLLRLQSPRGHKIVWTRFDINQLFALYSNKLDNKRVP